MEVAVAAGSAALFTACKAALDEHPELTSAVATTLKKLRSALTNERTSEDLLLAALRGLPVAFDAERRSLDASRRGLTPDNLRRLASSLQQVPSGTVLKLNLSHTPLAEVAPALAHAHLALSALSALRMRGCALTDAGVAPICRALHHADAAASSQLAELALASNGLTAASADALAAAVRELPTLQSLDMSYNPLGRAGCVAIGEALAEVRALTCLSLASVGLDDEGCAALAEIISVVPSLSELDLDGNAASDGAVGALLGMASRSDALASLRLSANAIGTPGALAVAAHLVARPAGPLRSLSLSNNALGAAGGDALRAALRSNTAIAELSLTGTGATADTLVAVGDAIARNRAAQRRSAQLHTKSLPARRRRRSPPSTRTAAAAAAAAICWPPARPPHPHAAAPAG